MTGQDIALPIDSSFSRRGSLLLGAGMLSATAIALMAGRDALAADHKASPQQLEADARILNTALGAELEAVAAYAVGAKSGLLGASTLAVAQQFQGHHKEHADALAAAIGKMGGKPVSAKASYAFPVDKLKNESDVLRFAAGLERGAVSAYLGAVPLFTDRALAQVAGSILADEAMHWAVLRHALGENPVPSAFLS